MKTTAILCAGSWGTALAIQLCRTGLKTALWGRDARAVEQLRAAGMTLAITSSAVAASIDELDESFVEIPESWRR